MRGSLALAISIALASLVARPAASLEYDKVWLLNALFHNSTNTSTYLFRTDEPVINDEFQYRTLITFMKWRAYAWNVSMPGDDFYLVDVSLNNNISDGHMIKVEEDYFSAHPHRGEFWSFPLCGSPVDPYGENATARAAYVRSEAYINGSCDDLVHRVPRIHAAFHTPHPTKSKVVFFHCESGSDRTGEMTGAYMMRYRTWSAAGALGWDTQIAGRALFPVNVNGMVWYCFYIKLVAGIDVDCSGATDMPWPTRSPN